MWWLLPLLLGTAQAQGNAQLVVVDIDLLARPDQPEASLLWRGVTPAETDGSWLLPGAEPRVLDATQPMALTDRWSLALPMMEGLQYFAVLDADGNGAPDVGEPIAGPVSLRAAAGSGRTRLTVDRRLGRDEGPRRAIRAAVPIAPPSPRRDSDGSTQAPEPRGEGTPTDVTITVASELGFFAQGRFVAVGFPPGTPWPGGVLPEDAAFVWTGAPVALRWPLTTTVALPSGLDLVFGLDLDGDGDLGPGDLVARPRPAFDIDGSTTFHLDRTLPRVRAAPRAAHPDLRPR